MNLKLHSNGRWSLPVTALLPRHDVVYRAPVCDPTYSIPLGDGDRGALLYVTENALHLQLNKTDLWDLSTRDDGICSSEEENLTTCRSGAHFTLNFNCPIFESLYCSFFESRLSLADASARLTSQTPFGKLNFSAFSSRAYGVTVMEADFSYEEPLPLTACLERWGSRTFWRWYSQYGGSPEKGLDGTNTSVLEDTLLITQSLRSTCFCAALKIAGDADAKRVSRHAARFETPAQTRHHLTFYLALFTGKTVEESQENALSALEKAICAGKDAIYARHQKDWADFWERSFICFDDEKTCHYAENLWYLNLYYAACQMRGNSPSHFCNGLWGFTHDFVPWNYFFHYNMQLATFPLEAAGHPELLETYYDFRFRQLPNAQAFARDRLGMPGAFYADVCDTLGRNETDVSDNCTCGSQIALELYQHYLYSGDENYLKEKALPIMRSVGEYYLARFRLGEDGYYHIYESQGYEGSPLLDDSITDHVMVRALFSALICHLSSEEAAPYAHMLSRLFPYEDENVPMEEDEVKDGAFARGLGRGLAVRGNRVLTVGRASRDVTVGDVGPVEGLHDWGDPKKMWRRGEALRNTFGDPARDYYGFPDTEMAPVYPAGLVGIKDLGTPLYDMIYNSCCLHHPALSPEESPDGFDGLCMNWCLMPLYLARMGMVDLLEKQLAQSISAWILYPQGFGEEGGHAARINARLNRFARYTPRIVGTSRTGHVPAWPFRHFDYETLPILSAALNEMLLQSYDGSLRLFPALKKDASVSFHLKAVGGHQVHAHFEKGEFGCAIECARDAEIKIFFHQVSLPVSFKKAGEQTVLPVQDDKGCYRLKVCAGDIVYAFTPSFEDECGMEVCLHKNLGPKTLGASCLGCAAEYET